MEKIYDLETKSASFLVMAEKLEDMGVKNNKFFLELQNQSLQGIDPYDDFLSEDVRKAIYTEIMNNPWYFFREIPYFFGQGMRQSRFGLTLNNLSQIWCAINGINSYTKSERQTFKTGSLGAIKTYFMITRSGIGGRSFTHSIDPLLSVPCLLETVPSYLLQSGNWSQFSRNVKQIKTGKGIHTFTDLTKLDGRGNGLEYYARGVVSDIQFFDDCERDISVILKFFDVNGPAFATSKMTYKQIDGGLLPSKILTSTEMVEPLMNMSLPFKVGLFDESLDDVHKAMYTFKTPYLFINFPFTNN